MHTLYETDRLFLQIMTPTEANAAAVLKFYQRNKQVFEPYELDRPKDFYTKSYQYALLQAEQNMFIDHETIRFWIYEKADPYTIIGTVGFHNIKKTIYYCCDIGYKMDIGYWNRGYATEAVRGCISIVCDELDLHRVNAYVLPENQASIRLLNRLGFNDEGLCRDYIYMHGSWQDHEHFAYIYH